MNRIKRAFEKGKAFIPFVTAGDGGLELTQELVPAMAAAGADIIEIGIPFSDPIAEGPVIQMADERALKAGFTTDKLFETVKKIREKTDVALAFMTYYNPVFVYGVQNFIEKAAECGIDAIIIPDLPFEEKNEVEPACESFGISLISLVAPTSKERIKAIAKEAKGFVYCVSSMGVTGVRDKITTDIGEMVALVKASQDIPCAVGVGISTPAQARELSGAADGIIVGSAIVRLVEKHGKESVKPVCDYVSEMKKAIMQ